MVEEGKLLYACRMKTLTGIVAALLLGGLILGDTVHAQRRGRRPRGPEPNPVLEALKTLTCTFPVYASGAWVGGQPKADVPKDSSTFTLTLSEIDVEGSTALASGLGATTDVTVRLVGSNLHFLDIRPNGALAVTTVFSEVSHDGRLKSAHSRSDYGAGAGSPVVSQYYGDCAITR